MEHTIEQIQNDIMNRMQQFDFGDRVTILRELENFCGQQADEAMKMEYDMAAMEDELIGYKFNPSKLHNIISCISTYYKFADFY